MTDYNNDNIIEWAFDHGYKVQKHSDHPWFKKSANDARRWSVERTDVPYCAHDHTNCWFAPTAKEAITKAYTELAISMETPEYKNRDYVLTKPHWIGD